jgi:hypothetical protein
VESRNVYVESRHNKAMKFSSHLEALNAHQPVYSIMLSIIV